MAFGLLPMRVEGAMITTAAVLLVLFDCLMTLCGSTANDAAFNAWVTDNTDTEHRGAVEGVLAILPLIAMLIVAGGFGILVEFALENLLNDHAGHHCDNHYYPTHIVLFFS